MRAGPSTSSDDRLAELLTGLTAFVSEQMGRSVEATNLRRLAGGASHATWSFDAVDGEELPTRLVLRQDFETPLIEAETSTEFDLLRALHGLGLPVPQPLWYRSHDSPIGSPFMIMERVDGGDVRKLLSRTRDDLDRPRLREELVRIQAEIHAVNWQAGLRGVLGAPAGNCAAHEVDRWARAIEKRASRRSPLLGAALNWLRGNLPDNGEIVLLHGDYKTNNILCEGTRLVVTDWEMAHLGDPLEDLAWTMLWATEFDIVGGLLSPADYLASYQQRTGRQNDSSRLFFWQLFALVKLSAILLSGAWPEASAPCQSPTLGLLGRGTISIDARIASCIRATLERRSVP